MVKFYVSFILPFSLAVTFSVFGQDGRTPLNELKVTGVWSKLLTTNNLLYTAFLSRTDFIWYKVANRPWNIFKQKDASVNNARFIFSDIISSLGFISIKPNTNVVFEVISPYQPARGGTPQSSASLESDAIHLSPVAPMTGSMEVSLSSGSDMRYKFMLRPANDPSPC